MTMSVMSSNYQKMWSWHPRPASENAGLAHNRQAQLAAQNAKTGSHLSAAAEASAANAQMFLNLTI